MIKKQLDNNVGRNDFTDSVKTYYQELRQYKPISKKYERELLALAKDGDIEARNKIVTANLRFVFDIAKKYRGNGVEIADLISEGNKGIFKAIDRFDMTKDVRFFTYAVWWIRESMAQAVETRMNESKSIANFDDEFPAENVNMENVSMDNEDFYYDGKDVEDMDENSLESLEESAQKQFVVQKLLAKLDDRERVIIMKYFGLEDDDDGHSFDEISNDVHLSTERVRQLKIKAINTMRAEVFNIKEANFLFK